MPSTQTRAGGFQARGSLIRSVVNNESLRCSAADRIPPPMQVYWARFDPIVCRSIMCYALTMLTLGVAVGLLRGWVWQRAFHWVHPPGAVPNRPPLRSRRRSYWRKVASDAGVRPRCARAPLSMSRETRHSFRLNFQHIHISIGCFLSCPFQHSRV